MTTTDDARKLASEAAARADAATPGPWVLADDTEEIVDAHNISLGVVYGAHGDPRDFPCLDEEDESFAAQLAECVGNAAFIAAARLDVPALAALVREQADEIDRLRAERDALREERTVALARVARLEAAMGEALHALRVALETQP